MKSVVVALATLGLVSATTLAGVAMFPDSAFAQKKKCKKGEKFDKKSKECVPVEKKKKKEAAPKGSG